MDPFRQNSYQNEQYLKQHSNFILKISSYVQRTCTTQLSRRAHKLGKLFFFIKIWKAITCHTKLLSLRGKFSATHVGLRVPVRHDVHRHRRAYDNWPMLRVVIDTRLVKIKVSFGFSVQVISSVTSHIFISIKSTKYRLIAKLIS